MRLRALIRGRFYRFKFGTLFIWLMACSGLFLALDVYFGANIVVDTSISVGRSAAGVIRDKTLQVSDEVDNDDPKLKAADLSSLKGLNADGLSLREKGPRLKNPHRTKDQVQICHHPKLDLKHDSNKEAFYPLAPLRCIAHTRSLFYVKAGILFANLTVLNGSSLEKCIYRGIERMGDSYATYTQDLVRTSEPFQILIKHDFFRVMCTVKEEKHGSRGLLEILKNKLASKNLKYIRDNFTDPFHHNNSIHSENVKQNQQARQLLNVENNELQLKDFETDVKYHNGTDDNADYYLKDHGDYDENYERRHFDYQDSQEDDPDFDQFIAQVYPSSEVFERIDGIEKEMSEKSSRSNASEKMNVLIICLDSMSHLSYQRKLPKTYKYIRQELKGIVMHGYNVVGDATTANLLPLLTGQYDTELPETRIDHEGGNYVDIYPLLWYKFERHGYATLFVEDEPSIATFNLRLNGFEHQPTDHYMRPFWQMVWSSTMNKDSVKYCLGDRPKHHYSLKYVRDFFSAYKNVSKFAFVMQSELTHWDNNPGQYIDGDLTQFLGVLKAEGHLNNTAVVLMGDHGARYSKVRWTVQGKLEERLPMMGWVLPEWFHQKHPELVSNMKINSKKLTSPFDVHETLLDVLDLSRTSKRTAAHSNRGLSLFNEIPLNRTCKSAQIDMHWCTCLMQEAVDPSNEHVQKSAKVVMARINQLTHPFRDECQELTMNTIQSAMLVIPNEKVLKYRFSQDDDHRVANFSSTAKLDVAYYQLTIETSPSRGLYEATIQVNFLTSTYTVNADISRINKYGQQADCIKGKHPQLRKFCYCNVSKVKDSESVRL